MFGWQDLTTIQQILWVLAILSTSFFVFTTLLASLGLGDSDIDFDASTDVPDVDVNVDAADGLDGMDAADVDGLDSADAATSELLEYLSFRNILAFTLGFSWTGVLFFPQLNVFSLLLAVPAGCLFAYLNKWLTERMHSLESKGNADLYDAMGQWAKVSVAINENLKGQGKVIVRVRDREMELLAQTEDDEALKRGDQVQVYDVNDGILWVSKKDRLGLDT